MKTIQVSVYQTRGLRQQNGRVPKRNVKRYLENAISKTKYDHDVRAEFEPIRDMPQKAVCGENSAIRPWWEAVNSDSVEWVAKDSNVLLTAANSGGCGYIGGNACTAPGGEQTKSVEYVESHDGSGPYGNLYSTMHEVGHNLGASHDHNDEKTGAQHWGTAWNEPKTLFGVDMSWLLGGTFHKTPNVGGYDAINVCGESIPPKEYDDVIFEFWYHDCAINRFEIQQ